MDSYLGDRRRTSIGAADVTDAAGYRRATDSLEQQEFWTGAGPVRGLWTHQRSAIALTAAYLSSEKALPSGGLEAALIKMPTGTGKSGVVAVIARCLPDVRRALVLTPRTALAEQLKDDIAFRFWRNVGYSATGATYSDVRIPEAKVELLLPNPGRLRSLMALPDGDRAVVVGTMQALDGVRIARDRLERKLRQKGELSDADAEALQVATKMMAWLKGFDLVIVDEGHYEPAPSWSRSIRELRLPTVLLSATPFRNDYKLFQVKGRFVFNYPFAMASSEKIIRAVTLGSLPAVAASRPPALDDAEDTGAEQMVTAEDRSAVEAFVAALKAELPGLLSGSGVANAKAIVRAASYEILELLQSELEQAFGETPVLIHDRVEGKAADKERRRYNNVGLARKVAADATLWLHQSKLLEGIDEPTYVVVAIFDPFTNARQFVQQVGRVLRSTDPTRTVQQTAYVLLPSDVHAAAEAEWRRYLEFEAYAGQGLDVIVPSEAYLPEKIVRQMPDMQYVDGSFRHRLPDDVMLTGDDVVVPRRAAVFELGPTFESAIARTEILESVLAANRFVVREIEGLPDNVFGWTFFTVDESPYLANHFVTEWRLGVVVAAQVGSHLFVFDSDGVTFSPSRVGVAKPPDVVMTRLLPKGSTITQVSANSLDMSDRAIRSMTQRTRSFAETFTDLLNPMLRPTTVSGYVKGGGRYLGIVRAKVADSTDENVPLSAFVAWAEDVERQLTDSSTDGNAVFLRYARRAHPTQEMAEKPQNILIDLTEEALEEFGLRGGDPRAAPDGVFGYEDLCADIDKNAFVLKALDGTEVPCSIRYNPESQRYAIDSKALNARHPPKPAARGRRAVALTERLNKAQSFRILTGEPGVVYMYGEFLKARDVLRADGTVLPLECATAIQALGKTISEKGENTFAKPSEWRATSVFGLLKAYCEPPGPGGVDELEQALRDFDLVLLDDDGTELGDFIAVGKRRLAIIHAKASEDMSAGAVTKLETVGRQCVASLAFCSTMAQIDGIADDRFARATLFNQTQVNLSRVYRNEGQVPADQLAETVRRALQNPSFEREVWIVAGRLLDVKATRKKTQKQTLSHRDRQLLMFLESLGTACGRANARLRVFGH